MKFCRLTLGSRPALSPSGTVAPKRDHSRVLPPQPLVNQEREADVGGLKLFSRTWSFYPCRHGGRVESHARGWHLSRHRGAARRCRGRDGRSSEQPHSFRRRVDPNRVRWPRPTVGDHLCQTRKADCRRRTRTPRRKHLSGHYWAARSAGIALGAHTVAARAACDGVGVLGVSGRSPGASDGRAAAA